MMSENSLITAIAAAFIKLKAVSSFGLRNAYFLESLLCLFSFVTRELWGGRLDW